MIVSAQLSVYPLRQESLAPGIRMVTDALVRAGLSPQVGSMSTVVVGEADIVFAALRDGFTSAADQGHLVMTVTVSNACPVEARTLQLNRNAHRPAPLQSGAEAGRARREKQRVFSGRQAALATRRTSGTSSTVSRTHVEAGT